MKRASTAATAILDGIARGDQIGVYSVPCLRVNLRQRKIPLTIWISGIISWLRGLDATFTELGQNVDVGARDQL